MHIIQKRNKKTISLLIIAGILAIAGGYLTFAYATKSAWPFQSSNTSDDTQWIDSINYSPPTEQEIDGSQESKKNEYEKSDANIEEGSDRQTVSVGIAFADFDPEASAVDVRAFIPEVIESDGVCTATFTRGGSTVSQSSKSFVDFSSSQCEPILIPLDRFDTKGPWQLSVSYTSSKSSGTSPTMNVEIK